MGEDKEKEGQEEWTKDRVIGLFQKLEKWLEGQMNQGEGNEPPAQVPAPPPVTQAAGSSEEDREKKRRTLKDLLDLLW